jgi:LysM domain
MNRFRVLFRIKGDVSSETLKCPPSIVIAELAIKPAEDGKKNLVKEDAYVTYVVDKPQPYYWTFSVEGLQNLPGLQDLEGLQLAKNLKCPVVWLQTLFDIAIKIPGVSIDEILRLNGNIVASRTLKPGTKLRIRKF